MRLPDRQSLPEHLRRHAATRLAVAWLLLASTASLAASPEPAPAQPVAAQPVKVRPMRFERLSIEHGLSQSIVNCILQDRAGFLWLGTQAGLNRFDGYSFEVYRHDAKDLASLAHNLILTLSEDPAGDLWIGSEGGGLARWRRATDSFTNYRHDPDDPASLSGDRVIDLAWEGSGVLWVATQDGGLSRFDTATETFRQFRHDPSDDDSLAHDELGTVYVDRLGSLWAGTFGGLDLFDRERQRFVHYRFDAADPGSLSNDKVRAIVEDGRGRLWVGTHGGLNRLDRLTGTFVRYLHDPGKPSSLSHNWVRSLYVDRDDRLWVGTDGGLNLWQEAGGGFASYHPDPGDPTSLSNNHVVHLYQDRGDVLWIGTLGGGANKWNPRTWSFHHYLNAEGGASNVVLAISEDRRGGLWIGTFGGGLERIERTSSPPRSPPERDVAGHDHPRPEPTLGHRRRYFHDPADPRSLSDDRVTALLNDRQGALWVGTVGGGLNRFVPETGDFERYRHDPERSDSLSADAVTVIFQDRRGKLWIGTHGGGLNLYHGGDRFSRFRHDPANRVSLSNDRVLSMAEDSDGLLWLTTDGGGLNRLHPATGAFLRLAHDPRIPGSLSSNEPNVVHVDARGRLWVGTEGAGLDLLEELDVESGGATFRNFSRADGLPDDTIWGIRSDASGGLWLSTDNGLARFDPETGTAKSYSISHGLQSNEFMMGAHFASSSGELFFGGVNGLNAFFPERIELNRRVPPVVVTSFTKLGAPVRFGRPVWDVPSVDLGYRDYFFSLEVAALDFTAPEENRYRYKLEGFDADWIDLGHRRRVTFTNLDAGHYTLLLKGSNNDGVWNEEGAQVEIAVASAPWRSWWAYTLYALAAVGVVGELFRRQRREVALERANARREREIARRERAQSEDRRRLLEELEVKNKELERFNHTVSHDLKSPLVTIKGFLGMLKQDAAAGDTERLSHDVRRIGAAADRMSRLLDELLELSSLGHQVRPPEAVALARLAGEALENLVTQVAEQRTEVVVDPDLPVVVGDRVRLLQLIQNLFANAIKYMGDQSAPRVEFGIRQDAEGSILYVRDNGVGIDQRYHQKVFGLFERLDAADHGTGVGLALAKRIVEMHGGRIWVESEGLGTGSSFCFTLGELRHEGEQEAAGDGGKVVEAGSRFRS